MKTRSIDPTGFDPFKDLSPAKPIIDAMQPKDIADVASLLSSTAMAAPPQQQNIVIEESKKNAIVNTVNTEQPEGKGWIRQDLPSFCVPYDFNEVFLRQVTARSLAKLHSARVNQSLSILIDAMNDCINVDVRLLTPEDFVFMMHWVRDNSYPASPLRIKHKTKYGNELEVNVRGGTLKITELNMTKEEYKVWYDKGFSFPSMRDAELINRNEETMDEEQEWMLETAQFIRPFAEGEEINYNNYLDNKFKRIEDIGPATVVTNIAEFKKLINHGIQQSVEITDTKFDRETTIKYFEDEIAKLRQSIRDIPEDMIEDAKIAILVATNEIREITRLKDEMEAAGDNYIPEKEVVAVNITATEFFP